MHLEESAQLIDQPEFRPLYISSTDHSMQFSVPGAKCAKCLGRIENAVMGVDGIHSARLDLGKKILTVAGTPDTLFAPVLDALKRVGYSSEPLKSLAEEEHVRRQLRLEYLRLGVTGACAGNIMLLAISQYAGASHSEFDLGFGWLSLALFLPVLLFGAIPFWRSFKDHLRIRHLSIDAPVIAALSVGTAFSTKNLISGSGETYFDSLSALIFLLLAARAWQDHIQRKIGQTLSHISFLDVFSVQRWNQTLAAFQTIPPENLKVGDRILLQNGDRLPADGRLVSSQAELNCAVWTGEAEPQSFVKGQTAWAGSRLVGEPAEFVVSALGAKSRLGELLQNLRSTRQEKGPFQNLVNRVGEYFAFAVLLIATIYVLAFAWSNPLMALERALALTLLACPCALAIATPLALSRALEAAQKIGLIVKTGDTFEKLERVKNVVFDKTGTLTWGDAYVVKTFPEVLDQEISRAIYLLELDSAHPYGQALARHFANSEPGPGAAEAHTKSAEGVAGFVNGVHYQIGRCPAPQSDSDSPWTWIGIWKNGELAAKMALADPVRKEAGSLISELKRRGFSIHLMSGDRKQVVDYIASELGIAGENVRAECKPEEKLAALKKLNGTLMVGDGANDTLAMAGADVSVAVRGGMEASLKTADVYFSQSNLNGLVELIALSENTRKAIRRNLIVSLTYNLAGGTLALMGYIHPLLAAVLMPASSFTLVIMTLWAFRSSQIEKPTTEGAMA